MSDKDLRVDMRSDSVRNKIRIENLEGWIENFKEDMAIKLVELEEHIDNHGVVDQKLGHDMALNREVLQELMKIIKDYHPQMWERINKLLEYLGGE